MLEGWGLLMFAIDWAKAPSGGLLRYVAKQKAWRRLYHNRAKEQQQEGLGFENHAGLAIDTRVDYALDQPDSSCGKEEVPQQKESLWQVDHSVAQKEQTSLLTRVKCACVVARMSMVTAA